MTSLIRSTSLMGYIDLVEQLGGDPEALLRQFMIDPARVRNLDGVISHGAMIQVLEQSAKSLNCPDFGLQLSRRQDLMILGPLAVIALNSPTVGEALAQIRRYMHYYAPGVLMEIHRETEPGLSRIAFDQDLRKSQIRQTMDLTLGVACNAVKMLYGDDFRPVKILVKGKSALSTDQYSGFFGAPVSKEENYNALIVQTPVLDKSIDQSDEKIHHMLEVFLQDALRKNPMTLRGQVEHLIIQLLPTLCCSLKTVAAQLGLPPRTLQRQLSKESLRFDEILEQTRRDLMLKYLAEPEMPMTQVATLLGYADPSSFNRACQRWFGTSPAQRRRQLLHC